MLPARAKDLHLLFAVGALGGFTTFSAFCLESFLLLEQGLEVQAALYIFGSITLSVLALMAGMWCIKLFACMRNNSQTLLCWIKPLRFLRFRCSRTQAYAALRCSKIGS